MISVSSPVPTDVASAIACLRTALSSLRLFLHTLPSPFPLLQATLSLLMDVLLSDEHAAPGIFQSVGRVVNALVAVFGPEFMPGTTVYHRCKVLNSSAP